MCRFFLDFPFPACQAHPYRKFTNLLGLLESVNLRKTCSKLLVKLLLWPKLPTCFDDVTTIENNRQVHVKIDSTLVAIFCIESSRYHKIPGGNELYIGLQVFDNQFWTLVLSPSWKIFDTAHISERAKWKFRKIKSQHEKQVLSFSENLEPIR